MVTAAWWVGSIALAILVNLLKRWLFYRWYNDPQRPRPQLSLANPRVPSTPAADIALGILEHKVEESWYYDKLFWQVPAWVTTVGALILASGTESEAPVQANRMLPEVFAVFGFFALASGYFLSRLIRHRVVTVEVVQAISRLLGDNTVRPPTVTRSWWSSSAVLFMAFIDWLGISALVYWLWFLTTHTWT